ncbi:MAG TPA: HPr-rel-A system PqqD family peptide chaperone [Candidatus Polarisedimenticolia bacterium]|nr:HPr-rel-A system PqqD family peptide chaperone [Candidatus Polarisedimenticolia bacterium]
MISTPTSTVQPRRRDGLEEQSIGGDLMVYDAREGAVHLLNESAAHIYSLCDGSHDLDSIERDLRAEFKVPGDRDVRSDVLGALRALRSKQLVF